MEESGARRRQRHLQPLDRRSARRHHQLPARHSALLHLDRAGARRRAVRGRHLLADPRRDVRGRARLAAPFSTAAGCASRAGAGVEEALFATGIPFLGLADHALFLRQLRAVMAVCLRACAASARPRSISPTSPPAATTAIWENGLNPWDIAAGIVLVREAGGFVTDLAGGRKMFSGGGVLASNTALHEDLMRLRRRRRGCIRAASRLSAVPAVEAVSGAARRAGRDGTQMTNPRRYLLRMIVFLAGGRRRPGAAVSRAWSARSSSTSRSTA